MPIFSLRRLSLMFEELSSFLDDRKRNDLRRRLDHIDTKTALAAEAELSMLWAISRVADMEPEPKLEGGRRPEAKSNELFASGPSVIEVRALSDHSFSGKEAMDRTANIVSAHVDHICKRGRNKGAGAHLFFEFEEHSYWDKSFHRERCVDPEFKLTDETKERLRLWTRMPNWPSVDPIRIVDGKTRMVISWREVAVEGFRTFCRMPPVAYDLEDNPIYKALKEKSGQVKNATDGTLRCVILVDAGCSLLRWLRPMSAVHEVSGDAIIRHAIRKRSIDVVIVISPHRQQELVFTTQSTLHWNITCFDRRLVIPEGEYDRIRSMAEQLPRPRLEGYQARDLHRQRMFEIGHTSWNLPTKIVTRAGGIMTIKLSAGLLHQYLAGMVDAEQFSDKAFDSRGNPFTGQLQRGHTIQNVRFESGGVDEDDDYVVFDLDLDFPKQNRRNSGGD